MAASDLGSLDAILLSHDHHADNLDDAGRALLPTAGTVVTTTRIIGDVIGFAVTPEGAGSALWISGDTVLFDGVRQVADRIPVDVAVLRPGGVRFGITGPIRCSMTGADAVELLGLIKPRVVVPVHYEGWSHFRESEPHLHRALDDAPDPVGPSVRWLTPGVPAAF